MRRLLVLGLLVTAVSAQVQRPFAGVVVREGGRLDAVEGIAGSAQALTLLDGVLDALRTPCGFVLKQERRIEFLDSDGKVVAGMDAPAGRARFALSPDGERVFAYLPEEKRGGWLRWPAGGEISWERETAVDAPGQVLAVRAQAGSWVRFAIQDESGIRVEDLDPETGAWRFVESAPGARGPAGFDLANWLVTAPESVGAERMERLEGGWLLRRGSEAWLWDGSQTLTSLPAAADDALVLTWRKSLTEETVITDSFDMPPAAPGAPAEVRFRVRNTGSTPIRVFRLVTEGSAFELFNEFVIPKDIAPDGTGEFWVRFAPPASGGPVVGKLRINDRNVELRGGTSAITLPEVLLNGQWTGLSTSGANRVGDGERGVPFVTRLRMRATAGEPEAPIVTGGGFVLENQGGGEYNLRVSTETNGMAEGQLVVSGRTYRLQVFVFEPAPPKPSLQLSVSELAYAKQETLTIALSEVAKSTASGQLSLSFQPDAAGVKDDSTLGWMPTLSRTVSFTIAPGATAAKFNGADSIILQTGTTAGTLTITATLVGVKDERKFRLAPAAPGLQSATVQGLDQRVTLRLTGYDPMRDTQRAAFTFYLRNGQPVQPGRIEADVSTAFKAYFGETATTSGAFAMSVQFPVTGTLTELGSVEVELTNGTGTTRTQRLTIQ